MQNITHKQECEIDKMVFKEFDELAEISAIIGNYLRGDKLETMTQRDKDQLYTERIARFKKAGVL